MKKWILLVAVVVTLISCDKADVASEIKAPLTLNMEQMVSFIGKSYDSIKPLIANTTVITSGSAGNRKAVFAVLDRESPNPNFICEVNEMDNTIFKITISNTMGTHGTFKNTFYYFDNLLSAKYPLSKFYVIDADGGINSNNTTKEELYNYLFYNTASGAALEFRASNTKILSFCFKESDKAFALSIIKNKE